MIIPSRLGCIFFWSQKELIKSLLLNAHSTAKIGRVDNSRRLDKNGYKMYKNENCTRKANYANLRRFSLLLKLPNMDETALYWINSDDNSFFKVREEGEGYFHS